MRKNKNFLKKIKNNFFFFFFYEAEEELLSGNKMRTEQNFINKYKKEKC